jgi:hypothetical protein
VRVGSGREVADAAAAVDTAPVSRETSLREMGLPEKNSPEVRQGSIDGAGGKMSDWNESDWGACVSGFKYRRWEGERYLARDDECDGLDSARGELVCARDLALGGAEGAPRDEAHTALWVDRLVLVDGVQIIVLVLKVPDIAVALSSYQSKQTTLVARVQC